VTPRARVHRVWWAKRNPWQVQVWPGTSRWNIAIVRYFQTWEQAQHYATAMVVW
jgi:hypothetical protein